MWVKPHVDVGTYLMYPILGVVFDCGVIVGGDLTRLIK